MNWLLLLSLRPLNATLLLHDAELRASLWSATRKLLSGRLLRPAMSMIVSWWACPHRGTVVALPAKPRLQFAASRKMAVRGVNAPGTSVPTLIGPVYCGTSGRIPSATLYGSRVSQFGHGRASHRRILRRSNEPESADGFRLPRHWTRTSSRSRSDREQTLGDYSLPMPGR